MGVDSMDELLDAFEFFDKDGSGWLHEDEFARVMMTLGEKLSREEVYELIKQAPRPSSSSAPGCASRDASTEMQAEMLRLKNRCPVCTLPLPCTKATGDAKQVVLPCTNPRCRSHGRSQQVTAEKAKFGRDVSCDQHINYREFANMLMTK